MGKETAISWTDHTFNPWWGCVRVSEGCERCYAETFSKRVGQAVWGVTAPRRFFGEKHWNEPIQWNRDAQTAGVQRLVFCASMADVCETHRNEETQEKMDVERVRLGELIIKTPSLTWLLLTKRIEDATKYIVGMMFHGVLPKNVWIGCTAENQKRYDQRIPYLNRIEQATVRFISIEPQIGPVSMMLSSAPSNNIDWVIVGGESGAGCRPFDVEWARSILKECRYTETAFFLKQLGGNPNKRHDIADFPEDLQVREFPATHRRS